MGGKSASQNDQTTTYNTETYDLSGLDGGSTAIAGNNNDLTFTDQGAVEAGRDVALGALDTVEGSTRDALAFARKAQSEVTGATRKANERMAKNARHAVDTVAESEKPASERTANTAMYATAAVGVVLVIANAWGNA